MSHPSATLAPRPLLLGAAGHTCVAWWHAPGASLATSRRRPPAAPLAVVLASSWGEEDMASYDAQRLLACRLAEGGLGTLRFEWPDTGDSSAVTGAASVADALAAFDAAATQALALSGCERLAFVGLRLGALLAAHAAVARDDVDALVAVMPVAGGRDYVRAQSRLASGVAPPVHVPVPGAVFDAAELPQMMGGFTQPLRHVEALSALKWPSAATTSVLEALVMQGPGAGRTVSDALARMGVRAHESQHGELACLPRPGCVDHLPAAAVAEIVHWLQARAADASVTRGVARIEDFGVADAGNPETHAAAAAARLAAATAAVLALARGDAPVWLRVPCGGVAVRERVVQIGAENAQDLLLTGVLGERDLAATSTMDRTPRRAIVLLSSGPERRVGPHRLWVPWARRRAALGDVVLRLDSAGIGDSAPHQSGAARRDHDPHELRGTEDVARAVAWLRREHRVRSCTIVGLHAGALQGLRAALAGSDVQHVVAINASAWHRTPHGPAASASRGLGRFVATLVARARRAWRSPPAADLGAELALAGQRGVALDFVFSARQPGIAWLRAEAGRRGRRLLRSGVVTLHEIAQADHRFAGAAGRAELYARLDALFAPVPSTLAPTVVEPARRLAMAQP
jgi:alpha/beta superfamily hydrolase